MVAINTSIGAGAYGKTAQMGNTLDRQREDAVRKRDDAKAASNENAAAKREAMTAKPEGPTETRPPEQVSATRDNDEARSTPPRGSVVDISV